MPMRSKLGGHFAGTGMYSPASDDLDTMYRNLDVKVRLPSDHLKGEKLAALSGPVTTYNIYSGGHPNVRTHSN